MQSAPVADQQHGGENGKRISGGRGVEDSRDRFRGVEQAFPPDLEEAGQCQETQNSNCSSR